MRRRARGSAGADLGIAGSDAVSGKLTINLGLLSREGRQAECDV